MNYTHVAQRPVAHQSAALEAQASDRTNVKTGLPNNYAERYRVNYTHVAQRPVAHQSAALEAQASDRTNVKTGLPNNYAERYRGVKAANREHPLHIEPGAWFTPCSQVMGIVGGNASPPPNAGEG